MTQSHREPVPDPGLGESSSSLDLDPGTTTILGDPGLASRSDTVIGRGRSSTLSLLSQKK